MKRMEIEWEVSSPSTESGVRLRGLGSGYGHRNGDDALVVPKEPNGTTVVTLGDFDLGGHRAPSSL